MSWQNQRGPSAPTSETHEVVTLNSDGEEVPIDNIKSSEKAFNYQSRLFSSERQNQWIAKTAPPQQNNNFQKVHGQYGTSTCFHPSVNDNRWWKGPAIPPNGQLNEYPRHERSSSRQGTDQYRSYASTSGFDPSMPIQIDDDSAEFELPPELIERFSKVPQPEYLVLTNTDFMRTPAEETKLLIPLDAAALASATASKRPQLQQRLVEKFYADVVVGDELLGKIREVSLILIHVELLCVASGYRRVLEPLGMGRFRLEYERSLQTYRIGDYLKLLVTAIDDPQQRLKLAVADPEKLIEHALQRSELPHYYRETMRRFPQLHSEALIRTADNSPELPEDVVKEPPLFKSNPSLPDMAGLPRRFAHMMSGQMAGRTLLPEGETLEELRQKQLLLAAEMHIRRAANYLREGKNFEATQCTNAALAYDPDNSDALLARAIATHNMENYAGALNDLDNILRRQPKHERAREIIDTVLLLYAEQFESKSEWSEALTIYERLLVLQPNNADAQKSVARVRRHLDEMDAAKLGHQSEENGQAKRNTSATDANPLDADPEARKRRLEELEQFKAKLAAKKKR